MARIPLRRAIKNRGIVGLVLSCLLLQVAALALAPNSVLILADDLGFTDISPYGMSKDSFSPDSPNNSTKSPSGKLRMATLLPRFKADDMGFVD